MTTHLLFCSSYSDLGGGETWLLTLATQLDVAQYTPHLLVPREGQLAAAWRARGFPVHVLHYRGASVWFLPALYARFPVRRAIAALLREEHIAAVHSDYHTLPFALPAAQAAGLPCLWTCMGWWFYPKPWQRGFFRRAAHTFAHSAAIRAGFLGKRPFMPPERVEVLYPGVDTQRFRPDVDGVKVRFDAGVPLDAPVVGMVARFQDVKGHDIFQDIALHVLSHFPDTCFIVAGENAQSSADNAYKQRVLERARTEYLLRRRLKYIGFRADVERVLAAADVVVCPSRFEGYGVVNVEAMASGKPVVSTNNGGPRETLVDGATGYLCPPGDVAAFAGRIITLLRDPALRARLGAAGRARVEQQFSAQGNAQRFMAVVTALLAGQPPTQPQQQNEGAGEQGKAGE